MSSQTEQDIIQAVSDNIAINYISIATLALFTYDTILTLPCEVKYIWFKKFKPGTALYMLARCFTMFGLLLEVLEQFINISEKVTCNRMIHLGDAVFFLTLIGIQGPLLARAYAVTSHKRLVLAVLVVLGCCTILSVVPIAIMDGCDISSSFINPMYIRNAYDTDGIYHFTDSSLSVIVINKASLILFDTVVVVATLTGTLETWRIYKRSVWNKRSLTHLMAQQSALRFGFVLALTLASAILPQTLRPGLGNIFGPFHNTLSAIIICRFHLDLQCRNAHPNATTSGSPMTTNGSFHVATRMHNAVMAEFGDSYADVSIGTEASWEAAMPADSHISAANTTEDDVAMVEILSQPQGADTTIEVQ